MKAPTVALKTKGAKVHVGDDEFWALWGEITKDYRNRMVMGWNEKYPDGAMDADETKPSHLYIIGEVRIKDVVIREDNIKEQVMV